MSLYDDIDESKAKGWNSGIKLLNSMNSQLQLKKAMITQVIKVKVVYYNRIAQCFNMIIFVNFSFTAKKRSSSPNATHKS